MRRLLAPTVAVLACTAPAAQASCVDVGIDRGGVRFGPAQVKGSVALTGPALRATSPRCNDVLIVDGDTGEVSGNGEGDARLRVRAIRGIDPRIALARSPDEVYAADGHLTALDSHPLHRAIHGGQRQIAFPGCRYAEVRTKLRGAPVPGDTFLTAAPYVVNLRPGTSYSGTRRLGLPYLERDQRVRVSGCRKGSAIVAERIETLADDEAAATRAAVRATVAFRRARRAASGRSLGRVAGVAKAAAACQDDYAAAPASARGHLALMYFVALGAAAWSVDQPLFERWIDVGLARPARQSRVWAAERRRLRLQLRLGRGIYRSAPADPCSAARAWRASGFTRKTTPPEIQRVNRAASAIPTTELEPPARAVRALLLRHAPVEAAAALRALRQGVDEADERILDPGDPVWAAVGEG
jgi:hypothetical protein